MLHFDLYFLCFVFEFCTEFASNKPGPSVQDFQMAIGPVLVETAGVSEHTTEIQDIQDKWPQAKSRVIHL